MARTKGSRKSTSSGAYIQIQPRRRCRVLVVSLLVQNPTAIRHKETTAEPAAGVTTRARSRHIAALPEEILGWEIFVRLPAKDVLRCRAVCRSWRGFTSAPDFLLAHHHRQPSLPLITLYGTALEHGRPLVGLYDYKGFQLQASCDGLLLFSFSDDQFRICNPTTRRSAPLPRLTAAGHINIAALYLHHPSREYRVLYRKEAAYYILTLRRGRSPHRIGVPSDIPGIDKAMPAWPSKLGPPVVFCNCLHWDLGCNHTGILVFDTVAETFRLMRRPSAATKLCTRLCDMEGSLGFSCNDDGGRTVAIWVLKDYKREVWSIKYRAELSVESFPNVAADTQHLVLSPKGDELFYMPSSGYMLHCDSTGKLLEKFRCDSRGLSIVGHQFKESLVNHHISLRQGCARLFRSV